jgi:class 3 adenylate cyclase
MALSDELTSEVKSFLISEWNTREGAVVPEADTIRLGNDAVTFEEVAVLYADLAGSTALVNGYKDCSLPRYINLFCIARRG